MRHRLASCTCLLRAAMVVCAAMALARLSGAQELTLSGLEFHSPCPAAPYYHFTATLNLPKAGTVFIQELAADSEPVLDYFLLAEDEKLDPDRPRERRRMVIARGLKSTRPETTYAHPTLVGRLDWRAGETYAITISLNLGGKDGAACAASIEGKAPDKGGYWDPAWTHYQSVVVSETAGIARKDEPVYASFVFYPDTLTEPAREIRVVRFDHRAGTHTEVPYQVMDMSLVDSVELPMYDEKGKQKPATYIPTTSATLLFPASVGARESAVYLVFYGNAQAAAPGFASDLALSGDAPGLTVENAYYRLKLHNDSGMLDELTLKAKPDATFKHKKETNGAIQWNPDCYAPPRPWVHLSDWLPGKHDYEYEELRGPLVFRTRRWGEMPMMPELLCSMEYEFYAGLPYFRMRSTMEVRHQVDVEALRNAEVVFAREVFNEAAWWDLLGRRVETRDLRPAPDLTEWTMPVDTPWLALLDRERGYGFAGIQVSSASAGLEGRLRTLNPYMYITVGPWIYWTRALAYPYGGTNPQQLVRIVRGSVFAEEWAYLPFEVIGKGDRVFTDVQRLQEAITHPLHVKVEAPIDPRMQVPEELYIEPTATGWEEK
ncbi:MAG: hypothetical protein IT364_22825 [Candidatus Hydrogenedentes bacterium]|nr:hypothetical protein [Candidatus Hydrogenedentota bacterium]